MAVNENPLDYISAVERVTVVMKDGAIAKQLILIRRDWSLRYSHGLRQLRVHFIGYRHHVPSRALKSTLTLRQLYGALSPCSASTTSPTESPKVTRILENLSSTAGGASGVAG
jgi:hypothetical protein